jgi:hypothetical protein
MSVALWWGDKARGKSNFLSHFRLGAENKLSEAMFESFFLGSPALDPPQSPLKRGRNKYLPLKRS